MALNSTLFLSQSQSCLFPHHSFNSKSLFLKKKLWLLFLNSSTFFIDGRNISSEKNEWKLLMDRASVLCFSFVPSPWTSLPLLSQAPRLSPGASPKVVHRWESSLHKARSAAVYKSEPHLPWLFWMLCPNEWTVINDASCHTATDKSL